MARIPAIALSALMLTACSTTYDLSAVPQATAAMDQATALCERDVHQNHSQYTACRLAAERSFANSIHLARMELFETYAARMLALAADRDAGRLNQQQMEARAASIRNDYWLVCNCSQYGRQRYVQGWGPPLL